MKWLLILLFILGVSLLLYFKTQQNLVPPPVSFEKPAEVQPELKEKVWLEVKLINPPDTSKTYQFKIEGEAFFQSEPFIIKDIRLYKPTGERIIKNRFLLPEDLKNPKKITLIALPGENIAEANITPELTTILKDKTGKTLFEISVLKEKGL